MNKLNFYNIIIIFIYSFKYIIRYKKKLIKKIYIFFINISV